MSVNMYLNQKMDICNKNVFQASKSYGSFPDRLYVILDGVVVFQVNTYMHMIDYV